jgi:hypothetical protein
VGQAKFLILHSVDHIIAIPLSLAHMLELVAVAEAVDYLMLIMFMFLTEQYVVLSLVLALRIGC